MKKSTVCGIVLMGIIAFAILVYMVLLVGTAALKLQIASTASETQLENYKDAVNRGIAYRKALRALYESEAFLGWPIAEPDYRRMTSPIGSRTLPEYGGQYREHMGLDMVGVWNARIIASADGYISDVYPHPHGYWKGHETKGGYIEITHRDGWVTRYSHMSEVYPEWWVIGTPVQRGAELGRQGNTGLSLAQHLHYEVLRDGSHVNPLRYLEEVEG